MTPKRPHLKLIHFILLDNQTKKDLPTNTATFTFFFFCNNFKPTEKIIFLWISGIQNYGHVPSFPDIYIYIYI